MEGNWLKTHSQDDFNSKDEAKEIYLEAKGSITL